MKKIASLIAACLLAAGCTTTGPGSMAPAPTVHAVAATAAHAAGKTEVLWLGQAAVRITTPGGKVIMVDPFLTANPKTPAEFKHLEALGKIDMILVTHAHADHFLDAPALAKLNKAPIWNAGGMGNIIVTLGIVPPELAPRFGKGGTIAPFGPTGPKVTAVHAEHASEFVWKDPATGKDETYMGGEPCGYIIEMENGFRIWHMGDTGLFSDMKMIGERYHPDLVIAPIGGHFTMDPKDAAYAMADWVHPRYAMPVHYGTYPILRGTPAEFKAALGASPVQMIVIDPGQKVEF